MGIWDSIVEGVGEAADVVKDVRGYKKEKPVTPAKTKTIIKDRPTTKTKIVTKPGKTKVVEKPVYIQAPPEIRTREVVQSPEPPPVSYVQDTSQWRMPEQELAQAQYEQAQEQYHQNPTYQAGVEDIQSQMAAEEQEIREILKQAHESYENMKEASQFKGYWEDKTTGSKIMAAIGIAFGAVGSGLEKRKNQAIEVLERNIERDIKIKEKRITKQLNNVTRANVNATLKQKKIQQLQKELTDLSLGKPYAVAAAQAAALANKTGNPDHLKVAQFLDESLAMRNLESKANDLAKLKQQSTVRNYADQQGAPKSTLTRETITGKMLKPITGKGGGGDKPLTKVQAFAQEDKLRNAATSKVFGKAYDYAANFERFRIKLKTMLNSTNPYDHYNILLESAKLLQGDKSVVREPEMRAFASATNLGNTLKNWVNNWTVGTKFQRSQIQDLYQTMTKGASASASQYKKMIKPLLNHADLLGIPHENIYSKNAMYMTDDEVREEYNRRKGLK